MSDEIGTYTFLPWLRQGIANKIAAADGDVNVKVRAAIEVKLDLQGSGGDGGDVTHPITKNVALYGPGDVIGIESRAIVRSEPHHWVTNFEPNYLPCVEFYDEDFPWRYTPVAPDGARLRPWITLIVLEESEFKEGGNASGKPLPFIEVENFENAFPPAGELWAWAHVHVNANLVGDQEAPVSGDVSGVLARLEAVLAGNPDMAYSRLVSPRKLDASKAYHAFVVPTFETGRLAGLGLDPAAAPHATFSAWGEGRQLPTLFPFYHRWFFRTGARGDFEYLVRLLEPKPADARVGRRDIDVQDPGSNVTGITEPELEGVLKLGGALLAPLSDEDEQVIEKWETWDTPYPHRFQSELAALVNLADGYASQTPADAHQRTDLDASVKTDPDPLITPPIYGRWHALTSRLLKRADGTDVPNNANWVHNLNLDPRWRSAAGFGTDVIQKHQEEYMDAAWEQVGQVLEANRRIRQAQLAKLVSGYWYERQLKPLAQVSSDKVLLMTAPLHKRVLAGGQTVYHQVRRSAVTPATTSAPLRRLMRPRSRLMRYSGFDAAAPKPRLISQVNSGAVTAAPPHALPPDLPTLGDVADHLRPRGVPRWLQDLIAGARWLAFLPAALALIALILLIALGAGLVVLGLAAAVAAAALAAVRALLEIADRVAEAESILEKNQTPESVDAMPASTDFSITTPIDVRALDPSRPVGAIRLGAVDSLQSQRFKAALKDLYRTLGASAAAGAPPELTPLDVSAAAAAAIGALDPTLTIPRYTLGQISIPAHIVTLIGERFVEAMAYPEFDIPMYKPLADRSAELFVPNLNLVEQNSITLLKTNQRFIESYMIGLNHEFARELLWREYPTDQRGSYFRQFWDVSTFLSSAPDEDEREALKDIPPLHTWPKASRLGEHDHREQGRENEEELVLVIRGELLKKYPTAVIYAHRARWQLTDGEVDKTKERVFDESAPIKSPLYEAKVSPDIYFFGFDLTENEAKGDDTVDDRPGWFFVIKERPGEPRFGLDIDREGQIQVWNDLAWEDVVPDVAAGKLIKIAAAPSLPRHVTEPTAIEDQEKRPQWLEDRHLDLRANANSAELAYILFQAPVLMGVHASEMLPE